MELASKLFLEWFGEPEESQRLTVLDVGPAAAETVDFFAGFKCRIHFVDLLSEPWVCRQDEDGSEQDWQQQFESLLVFPEGTRFDLCLFWDLLHYLDTPALQAFNNALLPYLKRHTRGHALGRMNAKQPLLQQDYGIKSIDQIRVKPYSGSQPAHCPHPQSELKKHLHGFDIRRAMLLPDGQMEMLLQSTVVG